MTLCTDTASSFTTIRTTFIPTCTTAASTISKCCSSISITPTFFPTAVSTISTFQPFLTAYRRIGTSLSRSSFGFLGITRIILIFAISVISTSITTRSTAT